MGTVFTTKPDRTRQLFGTDGIRAEAGKSPLDPRTVFAVGAALGQWSRHHAESPAVLIGMDTRESGPWIAAQLAAGLAQSGVAVRFAGLITTPGVAYLTRTGDFVAGVMISASHNPFQDNGIKVFDHSGYKLPDQDELDLEAEIFRLLEQDTPVSSPPLEAESSLDEQYLQYLSAIPSVSFEGRKVVLDCGNGAATHLGPALFERLGATVERIACSPDGRNINRNCGAVHVEGLVEVVRRTGADAGFAFDGDADRCIAVSPSGRIVNGDAILLVCARRLKAAGRLTAYDGSQAVIATVMSNLGLQKALRAEGIELVRTPVGDKYVLEEMRRRGAHIGGEQSGHVIFTDFATTGDGLLTAIRTLEAVVASGRSLDELIEGMEDYPQVLLNVRVQHRKPLSELPAVQAEIQSAERELGSDGRVLVRFSGTEPLARVMVEGPTGDLVNTLAARIATAIRADLGG